MPRIGARLLAAAGVIAVPPVHTPRARQAAAAAAHQGAQQVLVRGVVAPREGAVRRQLGLHLLVAFAVLAANFALFWKNMLGGGDAKLMAAGALWIGPFHAIEYLAYVTIFGGALALAILSYRNYVSANAFSLPQWALRLHKPGGGIPYGIAIAAGGLTVFPATEIFRALV